MHIAYLDKSLGYTNVYYTFVKTQGIVHLNCVFQCKENLCQKRIINE